VLVDIFCTAPLTAPLHVTGPTEIVIRVPPDVKSALILAGIGFGRGELVRFEAEDRLTQTAEGVEVQIDVYVPADRELPIGLEAAPRILGILDPARAEGATNEWISFATHVPIATELEGQVSDITSLLPLSSGEPERRPPAKRASSRRQAKRKRRRQRRARKARRAW
jgi:hypothetical protein